MKLGRRSVLKGTAGALGILLAPRLVRADPADVEQEIRSLFGDRMAEEGRVTVTIPPISENGYSVPLTVEVESSMTEADHVVRIAVFAEENPLPNVARFELGPDAGLAKIQTRIRMGGSQRILAVAEMNDGSLWKGHAFSIVTLAACVI